MLADSRERLPDDRDRALTAAIVVGTLRWRNRLDWLLARAADRDLASLDPEVLDILRLSLFQLLDLTRVPAAAVVDDAVSLTKAARKKSAAGLTNAVLRKLARTRHQLGLPELPVPIGRGDPGSAARIPHRLRVSPALAGRTMGGSARRRRRSQMD